MLSKGVVEYRRRLRKRREQNAQRTKQVIEEAKAELKRQMAAMAPPRGRPKRGVAAARLRLKELEQEVP